MGQKTLIIFIFTLSFSLWGQGEQRAVQAPTSKEIRFERERERYKKLRAEESDIKVSNLYRRGPHLIYDCEDQHFACVSPRSRERCQERRDADLLEKKLDLRCAPLKEFESTADCERTQRDVMQRLVQKEFCWNLNRRSLYEF